MSSATDRPVIATVLPRAAYTSAQIFEDEVHRIFLRQWMFVGHESQLPRAGDFFVDEVAGESFVVVRDDRGELRVHLNRCRHRGHPLCEQATGSTKRFVCPYHQWTYGLDGRLVHVPGSGDGEHLDYNMWGLHGGHVEVWHGLIFVSLSGPAPPPLTPALEAFASDMVRARPEQMKEAFRESYVVAANWKIVLENYLECYHCRARHPELCTSMALDEMFATTSGWTGQYLGGATPLKAGHRTMSMDGRLVSKPLGDLACLDETEPGFGSGFAIVPMLSRLICHVDHMVVHVLRPLDVDRSRWETRWYVAGDAVEGADYDLERLAAVWRATNRQDIPLCEGTARGVRSRRFVPGPLHPERESAVRAGLEVYRDLMDKAGKSRPGGSLAELTSPDATGLRIV